VSDGLVAAHADAVVGNGDRARGLVEADLDLQFVVVAVQRIVVDGFEAQLVGRVGSVRNQLAQEDLLVRIQGVDHQLQQLFDFGLEAQGFFVIGHLYSIVLSKVLAKSQCARQTGATWGHPCRFSRALQKNNRSWTFRQLSNYTGTQQSWVSAWITISIL